MVHNSGDAIEISAYFNKNYEFDEKSTFDNCQQFKTKKLEKLICYCSANSYKVNLDGLLTGNYTFTVKVKF
jgi:hypothetical protein